MKKITIILFLILINSSCKIDQGKIEVKFKDQTAKFNFNIANVKVENNEFVINGENLSSVDKVSVKNASSNVGELLIISKTNNKIVAQASGPLTLATKQIYSLILSNSLAAATYTIDFNLCDSKLGTKAFDCTVAPQDGYVLAYDIVSDKWKPRSINSLTYVGTFDASSGVAPTLRPAGSYFVISVSGTISTVSFDVGDWIISNGSNYQKIDNSNAVTTVFGRLGAVTAQEGDYNLDKLSDVDLTVAPTNGQALVFDTTSGKWIAGSVAAGGGGGGGPWASSDIVDGTIATIDIANNAITNAKINDVAAGKITGTLTSAQIGAGIITNSHISGTAAIDYSKLNIPNTSIPYAKLNIADGDIPSSKINGFGTAIATYIEDALVNGVTIKAPSQNIVYDQLQTKLNTTGGTLTVGTINGVPNPTNADDVANKAYADLKVSKAGDTMAGDLNLNANLNLRGTTNYVTLKATSATYAYSLTLPNTAGTSGHVLSTDGAGVLSWLDPGTFGSKWTAAAGNIYRASGNVGIGTSSPNASLEVSGTSIGGMGGSMMITNTDENVNSSAGLMFKLSSGATRQKGTLAYVSSGSWGRGDFHFLQNGVDDNSNATTTNSVMVIKNNGNVGIGITNPTNALEVVGQARATVVSAMTRFQSADGNATYPALSFLQELGLGVRRVSTGVLSLVAGSNDVLVATSTGNVGIGTNNPITKLDVAGSIKVGADAGLTCDSTTAGAMRFSTPNIQYCNGTSWTAFSSAAGSVTTTEITDGTIVDADISGTAAIAQSKIANLTTDLSNKQNLDATLTSLATFNTNGILVQTAADTFTGRSIAGTANRVALTNGNGVAGNPTVDIDTSLLPSPVSGDTGKFLKATAANTSAWTTIASADVIAMLGFTPVNKAGEVISTGTFNFNGTAVLRTLDPIGPTDVATKQYVDAFAGHWALNSGELYTSRAFVGIGINDPGANLHVRGEDVATMKLESTSGDNATLSIVSDGGAYLDLSGQSQYGASLYYDLSIDEFNVSSLGTMALETRRRTNTDDSKSLTIRTGSALRGYNAGNITIEGGSTSYDDDMSTVTGGAITLSTGRGGDAFYAPMNINGGDVNIKSRDDGGGVSVSPVNIINGNTTVATFAYGKAGIGTYPSFSSEKLEVDGNVKAIGFISTSDIRLKKNITMAPGLNEVIKLQGVEYDWKKTNEHDYGLIAQAVELIFPHAVVTDKTTGLKAVKYQNLISPIIEAIKDLYKMIIDTDEEVHELKRAVANVEAENQKLKAENKMMKDEFAELKKRIEKIEKKK